MRAVRCGAGWGGPSETRILCGADPRGEVVLVDAWLTDGVLKIKLGKETRGGLFFKS